MIEIKTYINPSTKPIFNLQEAINYPTQFFIDIEERDKIKRIFKQQDLNYLNGAITIKINNKTMLNFNHWDLVDQLWAYLINSVEEVLTNYHSSTYFPDQPIMFGMKAVADDLILVTVDDGEEKSELVDKRLFLSALLSSAEKFYFKLVFYNGGSVNYDYEMNQINLLKTLLKE